jgi:hypothetical protein
MRPKFIKEISSKQITNFFLLCKALKNALRLALNHTCLLLILLIMATPEEEEARKAKLLAARKKVTNSLLFYILNFKQTLE